MPIIIKITPIKINILATINPFLVIIAKCYNSNKKGKKWE